MKEKILLGSLLVISLLAIWFVFIQPKPATTETGEQIVADDQEVATDEAKMEKKFTLEEVAVHSNETDCWLAIDGKVYDVTDYIASGNHPGGDAILQGCGKDATTLYDTRPMGSGTPHSETARSFLPNYYIGDIAP